MIPFRFGREERQLAGVFHPGGSSSQPSTGVLLCNPFGQEAVRLHRFYRVIADRLARSGIHVMRFDYFGTGDSAGDDEHGDVQGWCQDILTAHEELRYRIGAARIVWVGARLGGTLAAIASARLDSPLDRLIVWEPILDGRRYLADLAADHGRAIANPYGAVQHVVQSEPAGEAIGFGMSPRLIEQLRRLDPLSFASLQAHDITVLANPGAPEPYPLAAPLARHGARHRILSLNQTFDWTSEEALNTALVPAEALQLITAQIDAREGQPS